MRVLLFKKNLITGSAKFFIYSNIFLTENRVEFLEHSKINDYIIELNKYKLPFFSLIYRFRLIKLNTMKSYIKSNSINSFIPIFKFFFQKYLFFLI